jgi:hypothetical protein
MIWKKSAVVNECGGKKLVYLKSRHVYRESRHTPATRKAVAADSLPVSPAEDQVNGDVWRSTWYE